MSDKSLPDWLHEAIKPLPAFSGIRLTVGYSSMVVQCCRYITVESNAELAWQGLQAMAHGDEFLSLNANTVKVERAFTTEPHIINKP